MHKKYWDDYYSDGHSKSEVPAANPDVLKGEDEEAAVEQNGWLRDALDKLEKDEKHLIVNHYGLFKTPKKTYAELAEDLKTTRSDVQVRLPKAIRRLRTFMLRLNKGREQ